jgi:hypothetical protein
MREKIGKEKITIRMINFQSIFLPYSFLVFLPFLGCVPAILTTLLRIEIYTLYLNVFTVQ